jgi:hypothetical protein
MSDLDVLEYDSYAADQLWRIFRAAMRDHPDSASDFLHLILDYRDLVEERRCSVR